MSRKGPAKIRSHQPDPVFNSSLVTRIISKVMMDGKKDIAQKQVYQALTLFKKEIPKDTDLITALEQAIDNIKPRVEVRPRRIGGAVYQVPTPVRGHRQISLALRWLVNSARLKPNKQFHTFYQKLSSELTAAFNNEGSAISKRLEVERMAEANKAFSHLRW